MLRTTFLSCLLSLVAACSGGSGGSADTTADLSLLLTDAASDELSAFEVDVRDVVFTKVNGDTVEVLPRTTRVDFLQLESLAELVAGRSLDAGAYRQVTLSLDFSNANIVIAGQTTPASVRDADGATITGIVPVVVDFPAGSRPLVRARRHNLFVFDLDIDQSIAVDTAANAVTFTPVFELQVDPGNPKPIATNGTLDSVDIAASSFVVDRRAPDGTVIGSFTVDTDSHTVFQVDGVVSTGAPGLGALVGRVGERVFVQGTANVRDRILTAAAVEIGAGVPGNGQDWVFGHVVARSGGPGADATLTVLGRSFDANTNTRRFDTLFTVHTSFADTKVLRRAAGNQLDADAVNVGQAVWVFGDLSTTTLDATAATGVVRMLPTGIFGIANGAPAGGTLSIDLARFDQRPVSAFDFDVAGAAVADPHAFTVDLSGLSGAGIGTGSKVHLLGWIAGVGATGADATAVSILDRTSNAQLLFCQWSPPAMFAVESPFPGSITLDVGAANIRKVVDGFATVTLSPSPAPRIQPQGATGAYCIVKHHGIESTTSFDTFRTSLLEQIDTEEVFRVAAFGTLDPTTQVFSAQAITVVLH